MSRIVLLDEVDELSISSPGMQRLSVAARPGILYPAKHEFLFMLSESMLRERVAPDFVWQRPRGKSDQKRMPETEEYMVIARNIFFWQETQDLYLSLIHI